MRKIAAFFLFIITVTMTACEEPDDLCCGLLATGQFDGIWLLHETGYSPGAGYIIEEVPAVPAQTIEFKDNKVVSTVKALERIKFYKLLTDAASNTRYIALYTDDPETTSPHSTYSFEVSETVLKLYFRWCFEGCHMGFKRAT
jgi:hypothetical protein